MKKLFEVLIVGVLWLIHLLGQLIQTLLDEEKEAGTYRIRWDAGPMPGGIYFYRVTAGPDVETKKAVLIR
jgi:hypothetical protein